MTDRVECSRIPKSRGVDGCRGTNHDPRCEVYKAAMVEWASRLPEPKKNPGGHVRSRKDRGLPPLTDEQRAEISRENGRKGGKPAGKYYNPLPIDAIRAIRALKTGVKKEIRGTEMEQPAVEVAGYALERIALVTAGKVSSRKAPSVLKGAIQLRAELCDPIETTTNLKTNFDLPGAVAKAAAKVKK